MRDTRKPVAETLPIAESDVDAKKVVFAVQARLFAAVKHTAATPFRTQVIDELLKEDPLERCTVEEAYDTTQHLLHVYVSKHAEDFDTAYKHRESFLARLKALYSAASKAQIEALRMTKGCTMVHFRFVCEDELDEKAAFDELQRQLADKDSPLRRDAIGQGILYIKPWEAEDGTSTMRLPFCLVMCVCVLL